MQDDRPSAADTTDATGESVPATEDYPAGARIHQAVQAIGSTPTVQPPSARPQATPRPRLPEPRPPEPDRSVDLFGASASAPESAEPTGEPIPSAEPAPVAEADSATTPAGHVMIDLRDGVASEVTTARTTVHVGESKTWANAPQGWVRNRAGELEWRPVVTAADRFDRWEVDTSLGMVSVDVMLFGGVDGERIAAGRRDAIGEIVAETTRRGGHAVASVTQQVTQLDGAVLMSASGCAVTLRDRTTPRS